MKLNEDQKTLLKILYERKGVEGACLAADRCPTIRKYLNRYIDIDFATRWHTYEKGEWKEWYSATKRGLIFTATEILIKEAIEWFKPITKHELPTEIVRAIEKHIIEKIKGGWHGDIDG